MKKVLIIDYGMGNLASVKNMLEYLGADVLISSNPKDSLDYGHIILPGVGYFSKAMENLKTTGWYEQLNLLKEKQKNILGICLGAQLLCTSSEEGDAEGLNWFPVKTVKFPYKSPTGEKSLVPHMGWSSVESISNSPLLKGLEQENRFYFVHSYHMEASTPFEGQAGISEYNQMKFTSVLYKDNIGGAQFHPEKSHKFGLKFFSNFLES